MDNAITTKEKILLSALKLFVQQGIDKTSTAQICKDVGISSGALFVHYKTKQDLIDTLYIERKRASLKNFKTIITTDRSVEENIKNISRTAIKYYVQHYNDFLFFHQIQSSPQISNKAKELYTQESSEMKQLIALWQESGKIQKMDTQLFFDICWSLISVIVKKMKEENSLEIDESYINFIWHCFQS